MPAAAVIPAPIAYIKVVAVKKLVVGSQLCTLDTSQGVHLGCRQYVGRLDWPLKADRVVRHFYFEKIRVLKAG